MSADTLTFLQAQGVQGAKHFGPEGAVPYASGSGPFAVVRFTCSSLAEAAQALAQCPRNAYLVRGAATGPAIPYRRHLAHGSEPPSLAAMGHFLLPIDFDSPVFPRGYERSLDGTDLGACAAACRSLLPIFFRDAQCLAQATSSAGLKPGARVRLWFWCSRELSDTAAKSLLADTPVDRAIYSPSQPIYVCAPTFDPGLQDPYEGKSRFLLIPGKTEIVEVPELPGTEKPSQNRNQPNESNGTLAPASGAIADGGRNVALTALAGAARRRGASAGAIEALLTEHNAERCEPPLPDREVEAIARSVANYTPEQVAATIAPPKSSRKARKALKDAAARVSADPALLEQVAPSLRAHIDAGALTSVEAATVLSRAVADAEIVRPLTHAEIQATVANAPALAPEPRTAYAHLLRLDDDTGAPKCDAENMRLFFAHALRVGWDVRKLAPIWLEPSPWGATGALGEATFDLTCYLNRELGWRGAPCDPFGAVVAQAKARPFDPFAQALGSLVWDGTERLLAAAPALLGTDVHDRTSAQCFAWWLISAVARTYQPGCQADHAIVLVGPQGAGKSSFLEVLAGEQRYFATLTGGQRLDSKDTKQLLQGAVIVELPEMAALRRADVEAIKAFFTERVDKFRAPYARATEEYPRRCVSAATTNDDAFLHDLTGARRFWPIQCGARIDLALTREWAPQLWAEAVHLYRQGEKWYPTHEQAIELRLAERAEERRERESAEDVLADALEKTRKPGINHATGETWETWQLSADGRVIAARREQLAALCSLHAVKDANLLTRALQALKWRSKKRRLDAHTTANVWQAPDFAQRNEQREQTCTSSQTTHEPSKNSN